MPEMAWPDKHTYIQLGLGKAVGAQNGAFYRSRRRRNRGRVKMIRSLGCYLVQGYLIAKPMPLDDLLVWLRSQ